VPRIADSTFVLVANGLPESPPAAPVAEFLREAGARVTIVLHPLSPEDPGLHRVVEHRGETLLRSREVRLPSRPPLTYALDPLVPLRLGRADLWIGFNNLAAANGLVRRRLGRVRRVVYWAVDFVPDRFGPGSPLTRAYDALDRLASRRADLRVELSQVALDGRSARHRLDDGAAPAHVAPIGSWFDRVEKTPEDGWRERRVLFSGHLVPRQGISTLVEAVALLPDVRLDVTGKGPLEAELRRRAAELGTEDRIRFHGYLPDHRDVERLAATASVAAAPYASDPDSFTRFADPSKLRLYAAAGLPIVLTDVPANAIELVREAGAELAADDPAALADAIRRVLASPDEWRRRRAAALRYASGFDWAEIVGGTLARLGFEFRRAY
jgi:glycosyltransferase involved in cell wall biosynthesis